MIELDPQDPAPHYNLGLMYQDARSQTEAIACFKEAARLAPHNGGFHNTLAQSLASDTSAVAARGPAWDALERADKLIGEDAALAELEAELGDPLAAGDRQVDADLKKKLADAQADQALADLKRRAGV